jgi:hypothetical protein
MNIFELHHQAVAESTSEHSLKEEIDRRVYYQSIVYTVATLLEDYLQIRLVCGTIDEPSDEPSDELQTVLKYLLESLKERN